MSVAALHVMNLRVHRCIWPVVVLLAMPGVTQATAPMIDSNHLVQHTLKMRKSPKNLPSRLCLRNSSDTVSFSWWSKASNMPLANALVWGTNMAVVSEGFAYTLVYHPGSNVAKVLGIYDHLSMTFSPKIGWWTQMSLEMRTSGTHTWTISGPDQETGTWSTWSKSFVVPSWFKGDASGVRFLSRRGAYPDMSYHEIALNDYYTWTSTEGKHYSFVTNDSGCNHPLKSQPALPTTVHNTFQTCASWGGPHIKGLRSARKVDFMGIGTYIQAKSIARSLETQTYQCPDSEGTSIAVGIAIKSGPHVVSFISGITRINKTLYEDGIYALSDGTNVEVGDNYIEVLGPTTVSGYGKVQAHAWIRSDSPTGFISRVSVSLPSASTPFVTGECADPATFVEVPDSESLFSADEVMELKQVCDPPDNWAPSDGVSIEDMCAKCEQGNATLYKLGLDTCTSMLAGQDEIDSCMLDYCVSCGDPTVALMTAEAAASLNNVVYTPSNLDEIVPEDKMSPNIAMAHCMVWGGGHLMNIENERIDSPEGGILDLMESSADELRVQALSCPYSNGTIGNAFVATAVRMGPNLVIARGPYVTVNGAEYSLGTHHLPGNVTLYNKFGLAELTGPPRIMGRATVMIRSFGDFKSGVSIGDPSTIGIGGVNSVTVRLPAANAGYSKGLCINTQFSSDASAVDDPDDWSWPDSKVASTSKPATKAQQKRVKPSLSLFAGTGQACPATNSLDLAEAAELAGVAAGAVSARAVCELCQSIGWADITYSDALGNCSYLQGTPYFDSCVDDFCGSCGSESVSLVQASLDAYVLYTSSGKGTGTWPYGTMNVAIWGDPHVRNVKGEAFDIHTAGWVQMVRIPREADASKAELMVMAELAPIQANNSCSPTYIHALHINGSRLGGTPLTLKIGPQSTPQVISSRSGFKENVRGPRRELVRDDITIATFNNSAYPASKGVLHVKVGQYSFVVRQRLRNRFAFLDLDVQGILESVADIGGLLGLDDHDAKDQVPEHCIQNSTTALHRQEGARKHEDLGEDEHMVFDSKMMSTVTLL